MQDYSLMSVFPHMHLLGKDLICYAVTPTNDTINLVKIDNWDFEWQGAYLFKKLLKVPAGSMIYAKGNYDNTVSATNPSPVLVQSGFNTEDEMFVFIFQYLIYQTGDENISIEDISINTNTNTTTINSSINKLLKISDFSGRKTPFKTYLPQLYIYDDGTVEKRLIIDK